MDRWVKYFESAVICGRELGLADFVARVGFPVCTAGDVWVRDWRCEECVVFDGGGEGGGFGGE